MQPRMPNPAMILPNAMQALLALGKITKTNSVPAKTHALIHLRASQINSCALCCDMHSHELRKLGETDERLFAVAAWREAPFFTEAERAALALAEALTRLADRPESVTDEIWNEAARHYDEAGLAALTLSISTINLWNRLNAATRQLSNAWR